MPVDDQVQSDEDEAVLEDEYGEEVAAEEGAEGEETFDEPAEDAMEGDEAAEDGEEPPEEEEEEEVDGEEAAAEPEEPEQAGDDEDAPEGQMIEEAYDNKYIVRLRQGLKSEQIADQFVVQLLDKIEEKRSAGEVLVFEDFDISQNRLPSEQLEGIFQAIADGGVQIERFRAFGCPTINDEAATVLASWLAKVTRETCPFELHLSDCAITADGFREMMKALEENDAFPGPDPKNPSRGSLPLYLRLENNYIDESVMKQSIKDGIAMKMRKGESIKHHDTIKVRLLTREDGTLQQKTGPPPAPEDVPLPRPFREPSKGKGKGQGKGKGNREGDNKDGDWECPKCSTNVFAYRSSCLKCGEGKPRGKGKGSGKDRDRDRDRQSSGWGSSSSASKGKSGGKGRDRDSRPPWQALTSSSSRATAAAPRRPSEAYSSRPTESKPRLRSPPPPPRAGGYGSSYSSGARPASGSAPYNAFASSRDRVGASNDSRPPQKRAADYDRDDQAKRPRSSFQSGSGKGESKGSKGESKGSGGGGSKLPHPWEEHYSAEFKLNYYWNSKTGDSAWERPTGSKGSSGRAKGGGKK